MVEEGEVVLCTVDRIERTTVFVNIHGDGEGSIILSEIAPGRIRNLRDYVVPKKRIICKVLNITSRGGVHLSLRRVSQKEKQEVMAQFKQEQSYRNILQSFLKDKAAEVIKEIEKDSTLFDFLEESRENPKSLEKLVGKEKAEEILKIIGTQKIKKIVIKREILLYSNNSEGLLEIKEIFRGLKGVEVNYISAGRYLLKTEGEDPKKTDNILKEILKDIERKAKSKKMEFSVKEK